MRESHKAKQKLFRPRGSPHIPVRMATVKKSANKFWSGCREKETLVHCWWDCKMVQPLWKTVWNFLKKLTIEPPYDQAIPLLGIHLKTVKTQIFLLSFLKLIYF